MITATWHEARGAVIVPRPVNAADRVRIGVAVFALLAAAAFVVAGYLRPSLVGFDGNPVVLHLAGPALLMAALVHLVLVVTGVSRPLVRFAADGIDLQGWRLKRREVKRLLMQRSPYAGGGKPALIAETTREDDPTVVVVPAGLLADEDLETLYGRVKTLYA